MRSDKRSFPAMGRLLQKFDIEKLLNVYRSLEKTPLPESLAEAIGNRDDVTQYFPFSSGGYEYIPLNLASNMEIKGNAIFGQLSKLEKARTLFKNEIATEVFDERAYTQFIPGLPSDFFSQVGQFKSHVVRTRFAKLAAGRSIKPHIDLPLKVSVRVHVPLLTNPSATFAVKYKGRWEEFHLPADGNAYFINTAFEHSAINGGATDRVHLIFNLEGFQDIIHLQAERT